MRSPTPSMLWTSSLSCSAVCDEISDFLALPSWAAGHEENLLTGPISGIYAYGFERPSAIQQRAIMPIIKGEFSSVQNILLAISV